MKKILKFIYIFVKEIKLRLVNIFKIKKIVHDNTYYPELERKSTFKRYIDNIKWVLKYGDVNTFYNLYGFDLISKKDISSYVDYRYFMKTRDKNNKRNKNYNYIVLLRDKFVFEKYLKSFNVPVGNSVACFINGTLYDKDLKDKLDPKKLFANNGYFVKAIDGECAEGVYYIKDYNIYKEKESLLKKGRFIVQEKLIQNKIVSSLNSKSINTIRIVTVFNGKDFNILSAVMRIGTSKSDNVDNWAAGGIVVPIDKNGKLCKYGYYKPKYGIKTEIHPDSKIVLEGFTIPYWDELIQLVKYVHSLFSGIQSIGYDIAITENGPVIIEANDNWEISLMQTNGGLLEQWNKNLIIK